MRFTARWRTLSWIGLVILALFVLMMGSISTAQSANPTATYARFATPLSSPTNNGGKAKWAVQKITFVSHYPKGFDFAVQASSSAGKIIKAMVMWRHSTTHPNTMLGTADTSGTFTAHWKPLPGRNIPQWVGVDYWWSLVDDKGNIFETPHQYIEYADASRKWKRLVSEDAVIHWEASLPDDVGTQVAAALKAQRDFYFQAWGKLLDYKPQIIIYASYDPWKEWNPSVDTTNVDGQTDPGWGSTVQVYRTDAPDPTKFVAYTLVLHEVEHLYQQTYGAFGTYLTQVWFYEGDAAYLEMSPLYDYLQKVKDMAAQGKLPKLADLAQRSQDRTAYDVGYAFWKYLEVTYGPDTHRKVWEQISKGQPIVLALQTATGKRLPDLEQDFRTWLGAGS